MSAQIAPEDGQSQKDSLGSTAKLLQRIAQGSRTARWKYVIRFVEANRKIFAWKLGPRLLARVGVSDLAQQVLLKLYAHARAGAHSTEWGLPEKRLNAWLFKVVLGVLKRLDRDHHRKKRDYMRECRLASGSWPADAHAQVAACGPSPSSQAILNEELELVERAMATLPEPQREILIMYCFLKMTTAEVACSLAIPDKVASARYYRARHALGARITEMRRPPGAE